MKVTEVRPNTVLFAAVNGRWECEKGTELERNLSVTVGNKRMNEERKPTVYETEFSS